MSESTPKTTSELAQEPVPLGMLAEFASTMVPNIARGIASDVVEKVNADRQMVEDSRANHRNFNRMLTLLFALMAGLFVTWSLQQGYWGVYSKTLAPYSFVITVLLDSSLAAYSLIKKY